MNGLWELRDEKIRLLLYSYYIPFQNINHIFVFAKSVQCLLASIHPSQTQTDTFSSFTMLL